MSQLVFSVFVIVLSLIAAFSRSTRLSILALWLTGLFVGALSLTAGAELLAVVMWVLSTLVAISFVFFAVMFGEYKGFSDKVPRYPPPLRGGTLFAAAIAVSFAFGLIQWAGTNSVVPVVGGGLAGNDLAGIGQRLLKDHVVSLQVLSLTFFLVLVGVGVIASPRKKMEMQDGDTTEESAP